MIAMVSASAEMNYELVTKIVDTYTEMTGYDRMKGYDISYVKYQLLKKHDRYELLDMDNTEFKKELRDIITMEG